MDSISDLPVEQCPVLVVGGSMVGMTLSALLAKQGLQGCITIEKHSSTSIFPRAALFHPRTMQIYRELGLYETMKEESKKHYDNNAGVVNFESLAGKYKGSFMSNMNEGIEKISPTDRIFLTQQTFEPILRNKSLKDGTILRFSTELLDFQQDADGVTALIVDMESGEKKLIRASYMVASDGARSMVREKLGIEMKGRGLLSRSLTIYFNMDVAKYATGKYNGVIYINNDKIRGFFRLDKNGKEGFLAVNAVGERGTEESRYPADNITDAADKRAGDLLRAAVGLDDIDFEITQITKWQAVCDVAERFSHDRILIVGDAVHTMTPTGGFGGNLGIQDADNIAWKLALILSGKAGRALVEETYEDERRPVGKKTVEQVFSRYVSRTAPELNADDVQEEVPDQFLELGQRYHSRALMTEKLESVVEDPSTATATPGSMAHHVIVSTAEGERDVPIADFIGSSFVLLSGPEGHAWEAAARDLSSNHPKLPALIFRRVLTPLFCEKYTIEASGAVLVRPDAFVAWSQRDSSAATTDTLASVLNRILCLDEAGSGALN